MLLCVCELYFPWYPNILTCHSARCKFGRSTAAEDELLQWEQQKTVKEAEEVSVFTRETTAHKPPQVTV